MPSVSTTRPRCAPASTAVEYARSRKLEACTGAVHAEVRDEDVVPGSELTALRMRASISSGATPYAFSLRSETAPRSPGEPEAERDECLDVGLNRAREAPDLGVEAGLRDQPDGSRVVVRHARESGLDAVDPELVEEPRDLELLVGAERNADGCSPSRSVVS